MKFKHVIASLGLSVFTAFGLAAGFGMSKEAKAVKAEGEKTWMFRAQLNLSECSPSYEHCVFPEDKPVDGVKFHYYGVGFDKTVDASHYSTYSFDYYAVNGSLEEDQVITGANWVIHQKDEGDKWSVDITKFGDSSFSSIDKDTGYVAIQWQFGNAWEGDHWKFCDDKIWGDPCESFKIHEEDEVEQYSFVKEPGNGVFAVRNFEYEYNHWVEWISDGSVELDGAFYDMVDEYSSKYVTGGGRQWLRLSETGTYDFVVYDGHVSILKHGSTETCIYYVSNSAEPTIDYIYSWGGSEQFGAWPGTAITAVTDVEELTGNGVIHFQGGETAKLIYEIPVTIGYPAGDTMFMFNNGGEVKSEERALVSEAAYWWEGPANVEAGDAIEFLKIAEAKRNAAADWSVCNVSKIDAEVIVNIYNGFDSEVAKTYIDCTTVYTWKDTSKTENVLWSYKSVVEQLGKIAEIAVNGSSLYYGDLAIVNNSSVAIIIIAVAASSALMFSLLLIFKKKKQK